jgi:hypothetical protein
VKSENESWDTFEACTEIPYDEIQTGASVILLGELFTIKRSGKYKFRQSVRKYAEARKDYGETFVPPYRVMGCDGSAVSLSRVGRKLEDGMQRRGTFKRNKRSRCMPTSPLIGVTLTLSMRSWRSLGQS